MPKKKRCQTRESKKPLSRQSKLMLNKCSNTIKNRNAAPSTFFNYAEELKATGDFRGALANYRKGLKRNPNNNAALINIAFILIGLADFAEAITYLIKAIFYKPDQFLAYVYRSFAYLGEGKKAEAYHDFKFVYDNYRDKIHYFTRLDVSKFPRIDIDEAMEYCLNPDAVFPPWNETYFPTVDCPLDEICLQKDYCQQKDVCPQNDMALFRDIILRRKLGHPRGYKGETVLLDIDDEMDRRKEILAEIDTEMTKSRLSTSVTHLVVHFRKSYTSILHFTHLVVHFRKSYTSILNFTHRLTALFSKVFLLLILPFMEFLMECEVIIEFS